MAVFGGKDGLYASHLPMYHAPHDSQVVFRFHLADDAMDAQLRSALAAKPELWTLDPERFDLHRMAPGHAQPLREFTARFVQGHFERGGTERYLNQKVVVDEVLIFKRLAAPHGTGAANPSAGRYHLLGRGHEFFAVKEIDRRPDFDIIVAMKPLATPASTSKTGSAAQHRQIMLPTSDLQAPSPKALQAALKKHGQSALQVASTLYFETEDLK